MPVIKFEAGKPIPSIGPLESIQIEPEPWTDLSQDELQERVRGLLIVEYQGHKVDAHVIREMEAYGTAHLRAYGVAGKVVLAPGTRECPMCGCTHSLRGPVMLTIETEDGESYRLWTRDFVLGPLHPPLSLSSGLSFPWGLRFVCEGTLEHQPSLDRLRRYMSHDRCDSCGRGRSHESPGMIAGRFIRRWQRQTVRWLAEELLAGRWQPGDRSGGPAWMDNYAEDGLGPLEEQA